MYFLKDEFVYEITMLFILYWTHLKVLFKSNSFIYNVNVYNTQKRITFPTYNICLM